MTKFQKRHYEEIAAAIAYVRRLWPGEQPQLDDVVSELCRRFAWDNALFNKGRFIRAAEGKE